jgi:hypothetical protein
MFEIGIRVGFYHSISKRVNALQARWGHVVEVRLEQLFFSSGGFMVICFSFAVDLRE